MTAEQKYYTEKLKKLYKDTISKKSNRPCSRDIIPSLKMFFEKGKAAILYLDSNHEDVYKLAESVSFFAQTTHISYCLTDEYKSTIDNIMNKFHDLLNQIFNQEMVDIKFLIYRKLVWLNIILKENVNFPVVPTRRWDYEIIFKDYDNIFYIINVINNDFEDMVKKGVNEDMVKAYMNYARSETKRCHNENCILDEFKNLFVFCGVKLIPVYQKQFLHYTPIRTGANENYIVLEPDSTEYVFSTECPKDDKEEKTAE